MSGTMKAERTKLQKTTAAKTNSQKANAGEFQAAKSRPKTDRRISRTRDALGDALVALMQEKKFDDITVQDVLDRAGVGRSTFYVHYSDKDDLFLSDVEDFLQHCSTSLDRQDANGKDAQRKTANGQATRPERLLPVRELFAHIREAREFYAALIGSGKMNDVQALARGFFARSIEQRLHIAGVKIDSRRSAQAYLLAGSVFTLLDWWIDKGMKADPEEMDNLFHHMAWNGLAGQ